MATVQTHPEVREAAIVILADLWRHVAQRAMEGPENTTVKLPTRLRKLGGLDDMPAAAAPAMVDAAPLMAELTLAALEKSGYVVMEWNG